MKKSEFNKEVLRSWKEYSRRKKRPRDRSHQKSIDIDGHLFKYEGCNLSFATIKSGQRSVIVKGRTVGPTTMGQINYSMGTLVTPKSSFLAGSPTKHQQEENTYHYICTKCSLRAIRTGKHGELKYDTTCNEIAFKKILA